MRGVRGASEDDRFIAGQSMQKVFVLFDKRLSFGGFKFARPRRFPPSIPP